MINLLGLDFHLYGLLISTGILAGAYASRFAAKSNHFSPNLVWDVIWYVLPIGLAGARLYHVIDFWEEYYRLHPLNSLYVWEGGLGILGGLAGGFIGLYIFTKKNPSYQLLDLLNISLFGLPLGQAVGRLGNYFNQEVYGLPTNLPWGIYIEPQNRLAGFELFSRFHPLFAYESLWTLLGFGFMLFSLLYNRPAVASRVYKVLKVIKNNFAGFYLIWYGIGRFFLDFLRPQEYVWQTSLFHRQLNMAQLFSLLMVILGIYLIRRQTTKYPI